MSKYKATVTVFWQATGEVEIEADSEEDAIYQAETYHDGIRSHDAEEVEATLDSIECLDAVDEDGEAALDYVPKEQIALPGCESLVAAVVRR